MGKCARMIRGSSKPPADAAAASCLTLRSGRRVLPSACSPRASGRPRRHRGSAHRLCGAAEAATADNQRRSAAAGRVLGAHQLCHNGRPEEKEVPSSPEADTGAAAVARGVDHDSRGDSFERPKTPPPLMMNDDDCDAAVVKAKSEHDDNEQSHSCRAVVVTGQTPSPPPLPPTEAEMEAFFAAAELAERRRFAEAYNYDIALDRPLQGRFEWTPVNT